MRNGMQQQSFQNDIDRYVNNTENIFSKADIKFSMEGCGVTVLRDLYGICNMVSRSGEKHLSAEEKLRMIRHRGDHQGLQERLGVPCPGCI